MFSAHFAQFKVGKRPPTTLKFSGVAKNTAFCSAKCFLADSVPVSTKSESECLTTPAGLLIPRYLCILVLVIPSTEILFAHELSPLLWNDTGMVLVVDYFDTSSG